MVGRKVQVMQTESLTTKIKPKSVLKTGLFSKMHAMSLKKKAELVGSGSAESEEQSKEMVGSNKNGEDGTANTHSNSSGNTNSSSNTTTPRPPLSLLSKSLRNASNAQKQEEEEEEERKKREERRRLFCSRLKAASEEEEVKSKPVEKGIKRFFRSNSSKSQSFSVC